MVTDDKLLLAIYNLPLAACYSLILSISNNILFERHKEIGRSDIVVWSFMNCCPLFKLPSSPLPYQCQRIEVNVLRRDEHHLCRHPFPEYFVYFLIGNALFPCFENE